MKAQPNSDSPATAAVVTVDATMLGLPPETASTTAIFGLVGSAGRATLRFDTDSFLAAIQALSSLVTAVVFIGVDDHGYPNDSDQKLAPDGLAAMIASLTSHSPSRPDVVVYQTPATSAVKKVGTDGTVLTTIDRDLLNPIHPPEVVARPALDAAIAALVSIPTSRPETINPTEIVAQNGGIVMMDNAAV